MVLLGQALLSGLLPRVKAPPSKMSEAAIQELTDGFVNVTNTMMQAPATGPLQSIQKFKPAKLNARDFMKDFEEAASLSNGVIH